MTIDLGILRTAHALASHASQRQSVIAANIANADTPGYKAVDVRPFAESYSIESSDYAPRSTRSGHLAPLGSMTQGIDTFTRNSEAAPNGNTVAVEQEMASAAELRHDYDLALGIYRKSIDILRASLGK